MSQSPPNFKVESPSMDFPQGEDEPDTRPVVTRPDGYWQHLFTVNRNPYNLLKCVEGTLYADTDIYRHIITRWAHQSGWAESIDKGTQTPDQWILESNRYEDKDNTVDVIDQTGAQKILDDWTEFGSLPTTFPDKSPVPQVKTYQQLMAIIPKFNPYWVLEVCAFTFSLNDFSRSNPSEDYNYDASHTPSQIVEISANLQRLRLELLADDMIQFRNHIPKWITTSVTAPATIQDTAQLCNATLPGISYEDNVLKYIDTILMGIVSISKSFPIKTGTFLRDIPIPDNNESTPERRLQIRVLGLILGGLKYKLSVGSYSNVITLNNLMWALRDNPYYPDFDDYLALFGWADTIADDTSKTHMYI
jgi:hypothetical protein